MFRIRIYPASAPARKQLADLYAGFTEEAEWRKAEADFAMRRWMLIRQGHPFMVAHEAVAREARRVD
jgi:hypothetical protein